MIFTGANIYNLKEGVFVEYKTNLPTSTASVITAVESGSLGIYLGIQTLVSDKRVADIIMLK
jgi:hypothetical protein